MFYTIPEVKNPEEVHAEPGNSKLQCTGGLTMVGNFSTVHRASHLGTGINSGYHIYAPSPGISMHWGWRDFTSAGAGGFYKLQGPAVFYCPLLSHRQYMVCSIYYYLLISQ